MSDSTTSSSGGLTITPKMVSIVILAAVITPSGDPISLAALAVPMTVLYFAAIGIGYVVQRRAARTDQPAPAA